MSAPKLDQKVYAKKGIPSSIARRVIENVAPKQISPPMSRTRGKIWAGIQITTMNLYAVER